MLTLSRKVDECKPLMPGMERIIYPYCSGSTWRGGAHRLHGKRLPGRYLGKAVQVDPIRPSLNAPGTKRLKLKNTNRFQVLLSISIYAATPRHHHHGEHHGRGGADGPGVEPAGRVHLRRVVGVGRSRLNR